MPNLENRAKQVLQAIRDVQQEAYYQNDLMEPVLLSLDISEEEAIDATDHCLKQGWLIAQDPATGFFLRPGYLGALPVQLSQSGVDYLADQGEFNT